MDILSSTGNRTLPVPIALGYINALDIATPYTWENYFRSAVWRFVPTAEREYWLSLFNRSVPDKEVWSPLNYTALRLIHANMLDDEDTEPGRMAQIAFDLTVSVGQAWWTGNAPVDIRRDYGLQRLLSPSILAAIDQGSKGQFYRTQSGIANARVALDVCVTNFARESGIAIRTVMETQRMHVIIDECPFCVLHPNCRVFWGMVIGFLHWLHRVKTISEIPRLMQVNKEESTAHHIVLDVLA